MSQSLQNGNESTQLKQFFRNSVVWWHWRKIWNFLSLRRAALFSLTVQRYLPFCNSMRRDLKVPNNIKRVPAENICLKRNKKTALWKKGGNSLESCMSVPSLCMYRLDRELTHLSSTAGSLTEFFTKNVVLYRNPNYFIAYTIMSAHEIVIPMRMRMRIGSGNSAPAFQASTM